MQKITFKIEDLDCAEECRVLKRTLKGQKGIERLDFDVINRQMFVVYNANKTDSEKILTLIQSTGMQATIWEDGKKTPALTFWKKYGRLITCIASGCFLLIGFIAHIIGDFGWSDILGTIPGYKVLPIYLLIPYLGAIICGGWFVFPKAYSSAKHLRPDINLLMVIAILGAMAIGQWFEGATVAFLFSLALLLESWSIERARRAISSLLDLSPTLARVIEKDHKKIVEKRVEDVNIDDRVLVRPGEKIPLDGVVVKGESSVNQAPITGESMPVPKFENDQVFAGTINEDGALEFRVTKGANDTTLARIINMVQQARTRRAKSEQWVNHFARVYTPLMMALAIIVIFIPPLFFNVSWMDAIYRGLVLLVIACPCALVISTPVTIVSALTSSARNGVLIKGGVYLEAAGKLDALAFDKTGTVTMGRPSVQRIIPLNQHSEEELLQIAAGLEFSSEHPLARAILKKAEEKNISFKPAENFQISKGLGAEGTIDNTRFWIGSHRFMHEKGRKENEEAHRLAIELEDAGHSVIAIGDFTHICGLISIADEPRPYLYEIISAIKGLGIKMIVMLTGDNLATAKAIAEKVHFDKFFAELMPEDKVSAIEDLTKIYKTVAMVGDGVNDAPAMAVSSFGIAMGAMGTDAAFETADIVLMSDDLKQIPWLIRHSRRALKIVKQNIYFSLCIKAIFIVLAFLGFASLWMAIGADTGASLLVIFNGLRLLKKH